MTRSKEKALSLGAPTAFTRRTALKGAAAAAASFGVPFGGLMAVSHAAFAPVRLGYQFHLWGAPAVVAVRKGYFKDEGLEVADRKFASGKDTRDAMIANSVDIGTVGITPFIVGATRGDISAIGVVCYAGKTGLVMSKPSIKSVADLKGKRIVSQVGSSLDSVFKDTIAPAAGLKKDDYTILNARFADHVQALASGSADAFLGLEPFCSIAEAEKIAVPLTDYYKYDLIPNMLAVKSDFLNAQPDTCLAFLRAWLRAVKLFKDKPDEADEIMLSVYSGRNYSINPKIIRNALSRLVVDPDFIPELPGYIEAQANALVKSGRLDKVPDPNKILRRDLLQKAMKS